MKNQYVADAGDHGKLGLLRFLAGNGISIAVNWYLTENDSSNDGKHTGYLNKVLERKKDPELFDFLHYLISNNYRDVISIENGNLLKGALYYHEVLDVSDCSSVDEKQQKRTAWHKNALKVCNDKELVFLDPDNGIKEDTRKGLKKAVKHAFVSEVADYYNRGQNVMYYCSKARRSEEAWKKYKHIIKQVLPEGKLLAVTFHGGTQRTYIFVVQKPDYLRYKTLIDSFLDSDWKYGNNSFTAEEI